MRTQDTAEIVHTLHELLQTAQTPDKDGGPVVICEQHELFPSDYGEIAIVKSSNKYRKQPTDGDHALINADEFVSYKLGNGFKLMHMSIVRESIGDQIQHVVLIVLVKSKNN